MSSLPPNTRPTACFSIQAATEPSVMSRVLELFAKRGLMPTRLHSDVSGPNGETLTIDVQMEGLAPDLAAYMARCMRQIAYVDCVLTSERGAVPAAAQRA